jgi:hypothetical protein
MDGHKPSNKAKLLEFLSQDGIKSPNTNVKDWWPRRMKAVIENQGYSTK